LRDHHRTETDSYAAKQFVLAPDVGDATALDAGGADGANGHSALIVAELEADIPTLTVGEAVMRLDLAETQAMLFHNRAHGGLNMVYRRNDGNIGWVDPALKPEAAEAEPRRVGAPARR
jgi:hypothetical protein